MPSMRVLSFSLFFFLYLSLSVSLCVYVCMCVSLSMDMSESEIRTDVSARRRHHTRKYPGTCARVYESLCAFSYTSLFESFLYTRSVSMVVQERHRRTQHLRVLQAAESDLHHNFGLLRGGKKTKANVNLREEGKVETNVKYDEQVRAS